MPEPGRRIDIRTTRRRQPESWSQTRPALTNTLTQPHSQINTSILAAGSDHGLIATSLGVVATAFASFNVVGGFLVTNRMLAMFKPKDRS